MRRVWRVGAGALVVMTTGMGDYADEPPTRGVHRGEAESGLRVGVRVSETDSPQPEDLPAMVFRNKRGKRSRLSSSNYQKHSSSIRAGGMSKIDLSRQKVAS